MQQRVSNLWLSDELIDAATLEPLTSKPKERGAGFMGEDPGRPAILRSTSQSHRRMWQHLATALLLVGSAAFSYLAWSQSDIKVSKQPESAPAAVHTYAGNARGTETAEANKDQKSVNALRVKNRRLQLRIAELEEALRR